MNPFHILLYACIICIGLRFENNMNLLGFFCEQWTVFKWYFTSLQKNFAYGISAGHFCIAPISIIWFLNCNDQDYIQYSNSGSILLNKLHRNQTKALHTYPTVLITIFFSHKLSLKQIQAEHATPFRKASKFLKTVGPNFKCLKFGRKNIPWSGTVATNFIHFCQTQETINCWFLIIVKSNTISVIIEIVVTSDFPKWDSDFDRMNWEASKVISAKLLFSNHQS